MQKIYLSDVGPKVSPAIYGFYRWNEVTSAASTMKRIVNLCLELGINTFDHADTYGNYGCEEIFGNLIRDNFIKREEVVLFTKCGVRFPHETQPGVRVKHYDTSKKHVLDSLDRSLRKLHTDHIDIFLLNHFDATCNLEETALTLQRVKESGKVKNIGVANFSVFQHRLLESYLKTPIVTNHIELNLLNTSALDNGQVDYIKQKFMRPLALAPLAEGRVAHGTDRQAVQVRYKLIELSKRYDADIEALAVAWLVKLGAQPLIGTTNEQRIRNIAAAFNIDLEKQDWYDLYNTSKEDS